MVESRCTFATFVVGKSNQVAFEAARSVVERPGLRFNPLFVYGSTGLGKTHLLTATASAVAELRSVASVAYLTAEAFVNEMISALRRHQMERFRQRFRGIGTLIVDDIQFLADKKRSQEEFTHTFNALHDGRKQIVIASDRPPHELPGFEETLRSRFASGLLADIQPPDQDLRQALVSRKASEAGLALDDDVMIHLAEHWCSTGRQIEGVLRRIEAFGQLARKPITLALVREALAPYRPPIDGRKSLGRIVGEVCRHYQVSRTELTSSRPHGARHAATSRRHVSLPTPHRRAARRDRQGARRPGPFHGGARPGRHRGAPPSRRGSARHRIAPGGATGGLIRMGGGAGGARDGAARCPRHLHDAAGT